MRLLLHIGTEKTGSSYLQKLCAINRDSLISNKIYFAHAGKHENRMLHGSISPGNGRQLALCIDHGDWEGATSWLAGHRCKAESQHCASLLISNENIVKSLSSNGCVQKLALAAGNSGFTNMEMLLIIRDPVDQAVSLYKHRAKSGKLGAVGDWLESGFSLPADINGFLVQVKNGEYGVTIRKYATSTKALTTVFLHDWLEVVGEMPHQLNDLVNPSLTLSELQVLRHVSRIHPDAMGVFYSNFLAIPKSLKGDDAELERDCRRKVADYLSRYSVVWRQLNEILQSDGGISIPLADTADLACGSNFTYSDEQLKAISDSYLEVRGTKFRMRAFVRRNIVSRLRRRFAQIRNIGSVSS